jgi:hypothetical protein
MKRKKQLIEGSWYLVDMPEMEKPEENRCFTSKNAEYYQHDADLTEYKEQLANCKQYLIDGDYSNWPEYPVEGVHYVLYDTNLWYWCKCKRCGWEGSSELAGGGGQIADTGDYEDACCPKCYETNIDDDTESNIGIVARVIPQAENKNENMKTKDDVKTEGKPVFYAVLYSSMRKAALECGYALALHGSLHSDMDLMAMAWVEDAKPVEELVKAIDDCVGGTVWKDFKFKDRTDKPHGRTTFTISILGDYHIDLSVIPPQPKEELKPKVVCYCGSLRFIEKFKEVEYQSVIDGNIALLPCCMFVGIQREYGAESDYKKKADELHKRKIDICDEVFVLNVGGYIGESTRSEIDYAISINKPVKYLEAIGKKHIT